MNATEVESESGSLKIDIQTEPSTFQDSDVPYQHHAPITKELLSKSEKLSNGIACQVYRVDDRTVVKTFDGVRMAEAAAMRFVREKTRVPEPQVLDAYVDANSQHVCIVMEYIDGRPLDEEWNPYNAAQKRSVESQLKQYFDEIRELSSDFVGSADGSSCNDQLFDDVPEHAGPFDSETDFQASLIAAIKEKGSSSFADVVIQFIEAMPKHKIVFTHNDIAPINILVRDAKVVGIVDWGLSGF